MKKNNKLSLYTVLSLSILLATGFQSVKAQDGFIGEIRMFGGNFEPRNWAFCDGQLLPISTNQALFSILGTTFGGDGRTTFGLPDLRGRVAVHEGSGPGLTPRSLGSKGGQENVTLNAAQLPPHTHPVILNADSNVGSSENPSGKLPARNAAGIPQYGTTSNTTMTGGTSGSTGGGQQINNMPPFTAVNYIICTQGIFPSRN